MDRRSPLFSGRFAVATGMVLVIGAGVLLALTASRSEALDSALPPTVKVDGVPPCDTPALYDPQSQPLPGVPVHAPPDTVRFLSARYWTSNEAHDCQRLVIRSGRALAFGPLVAVLVASDRIMCGRTRALQAGTTPGGCDGAPNFSPGLAVAEIINHSDREYAPLHIPSGISCLWLEEKGDGEWQAAIVPATSRCADVTNPADTRILQVRRLEHAGDQADYPSTGRWMWDARNQRHFIGVRCGNAWCEVGVPGFAGTRSITQWNVPGWYDEQLVGYAAPGGSLVVSGLIGRIEPSRAIRLRTVQEVDYEAPEGVHTATITFRGEDAQARAAYARKFNLTCGCTDVIRILMRRRGDWREFKAEQGQIWTTAFYNEHLSHAGRGAVRWSWSDEDEGGWIPCGQNGCCRTDPPPDE